MSGKLYILYSQGSLKLVNDIQSEHLFTDIEIDENKLISIENVEDVLSPFAQEVVKYIAGFVVRKLVRGTNCSECKELLIDISSMKKNVCY